MFDWIMQTDAGGEEAVSSVVGSLADGSVVELPLQPVRNRARLKIKTKIDKFICFMTATSISD